MRIRVEARHIEAGRKYSTRRCPVALAVAELITGVDVVVSTHTIAAFAFDDDRQLWGFQLPPEAVAFVKSFNDRGVGSPFEFELPVPEAKP